MSIEIKEIRGKKALTEFSKFAIDLYKNNPYYIPELINTEVGSFNPKENPAFEFCEAVFFMAYQDGKPAGRIAGIINHRANEKWGEKAVRFGWVDFIDNTEVVDVLFNAVEQWGKNKGMAKIQGPLGFTDLDPEGMLIEGFDQIGTMVSIYNYPYYPTHMERKGYTKDVDWVEFKITVPKENPERHMRIAELVKSKSELSIVNLKSISELIKKGYAKKIFDLVNISYSDLYGYIPLTDKQIDYYVKGYISMFRIDLITLIINKKDELVGVGITMPNMGPALQKAKGKLFPFGFVHVLKALKGKNDILELLLVAVRPDYQNKGVNALIFADLIPKFRDAGFKYGESNPELELNEKVQQQWDYFEKVQHKRRRAFHKTL